MTGIAVHNVLPNVRDLGGLPAGDGRCTRSGLLYRSAAPLAGDLPPEELPEWPCRTVVDLRAPGELPAPHPLGVDGTTVHSVPLVDDARLATLPRDDLAAIYRVFVDQAAPKLAGIVKLASVADGPLLVHCAAGKDRTGVVVALLLACAGVARADIIADYMLTRRYLDAIVARLRSTGHVYSRYGNGVAGSAYGAPPEAITTVLDVWDSHPCGVHGWLDDHGTGPAAVQRWAERFTTQR
ncbi:tyrosine-protein phosphatase [Prauserella oleivorans]|uniref:Tyrosine-protein phosphatase n=1 Tax=Prauserella oleivorans TaxID=1478153 RepID=A0ABW5W552_9PSEU